MTHDIPLLILALESHWRRRDRARGDAGEGVVSTAIAILVMAFLGVAMWVGLQSIWETTENNTADQVEQIGR